jgi:hypothetical protein
MERPMHHQDYQERRTASMRPKRPSRLRSTRLASGYLLETYGIQRAPATLSKLRVVGGGPEFRKVGAQRVAYEESALDAWARALVGQPQSSTSQV